MRIRNRKKAMRIGIILAMAFSISIFTFNCSKFSSQVDMNTESQSSSSLGGAVGEPNVAFLTSDQMLNAMIASTAIEGLGDVSLPVDQAIAAAYTERSGSLPSVHSITQATGPTLIAVANLASRVCAKAVARDVATGEGDRESRYFFREFDFSRPVTSQTDDAVLNAFNRMARNAWRREITQNEIDYVVEYANEFKQLATNPADISETQKLAVGLCTAALASIDALTY